MVDRVELVPAFVVQEVAVVLVVEVVLVAVDVVDLVALVVEVVAIVVGASHKVESLQVLSPLSLLVL